MSDRRVAERASYRALMPPLSFVQLPGQLKRRGLRTLLARLPPIKSAPDQRSIRSEQYLIKHYPIVRRIQPCAEPTGSTRWEQR